MDNEMGKEKIKVKFKNICQRILLFVFFLFCIEACLFNMPGKCEREKKKKKDCILRNLVACELSFYRKTDSIDICIHPDGFVWALTGSCDGNVSYECGGPSSSSGSKK